MIDWRPGGRRQRAGDESAPRPRDSRACQGMTCQTRVHTQVQDDGSHEGSGQGFTAATGSEPTGSIGTDERTLDGSSRRGFTSI